jgi:ABC-type sugar transport system substrate-binding protein
MRVFREETDMLKKTGLAALGLALMASSALAADIKIGFVTTLTTPAAVIGARHEGRR